MSMQILIKETGAQEELALFTENYINWVRVFIGNHGGFEEDFIWDSELDVYHTNLDAYEWWSRVIDNQQELDDRISELKEEYSSDVVEDALAEIYRGHYDLEDEALAILQELNEFFELLEEVDDEEDDDR